MPLKVGGEEAHGWRTRKERYTGSVSEIGHGLSERSRQFRLAGGLTCRTGSRIVSGMKLTFTLPDRLAVRFQAAYPQEEQSRVVAGLLARKLRVEDEEMAQACRGANRLKEVAADMKDWEQLNLRAP